MPTSMSSHQNHALCLVRSIGNGWRIYRDMVGGYVVMDADEPARQATAATLAGAYAACRGWEQGAFQTTETALG